MGSHLHVLASFCILNLTIAAARNEILIIISSQENNYHSKLSENLRKDIYQQAVSVGRDYVVNVQVLHEIFNYPGDWTILSALPRLVSASRLISSRTKWVILCEDSTNIILDSLLHKLSYENHSELLYMGRPLYDQDATIIHHFAFFENPRWFAYPLLRSGVVFTVPLLKRMAAQVAQRRRPRTEFSIDSSHELARFIMENVHVDRGGRLEPAGAAGVVEGFASRSMLHVKHVDSNRIPEDLLRMREVAYICQKAATGPKETCAMYSRMSNKSQCLLAQRNSIYFAIKTCHKFHQNRVSIIENTWGRHTVHKRYFSDIEDEDIPTIDTGVPNTDTGHCAKTFSILKLALKDIETINRYQQYQGIQWIFLSDDDTLLSVSGVCDILGCFNPLEDVYLGERYGYRLYAEDGFNYITGGGGIALSLPVVRKILQHCSCPARNAPDDMILGSCLHSLQVRAIHSARFHQARPRDYPTALLEVERPISFHKFWQLDPETEYRKWFSMDDVKLIDLELNLKMELENAERKRIPPIQVRHSFDKGSREYAIEPLERSNTRSRSIREVQKLPLIGASMHSRDEHIDL